MSVNYQKVWRTMNDLEAVTSKICSAREIIDNAVDAIQQHKSDKAELLMTAAYEFLEYYLQEFDDKFKLAWQATVGDLRDGDKEVYDAVIKEREYYEGKATLSCDKDDPSPECKGVWDSFWEENYYPEENQQYAEEELNAMCDKAELDAQVERVRKEGGYDWTPEQQIEYTNAKIEVNSPYNDGWTKEHYQKIVDEYDRKSESLVCNGDDSSEECKNSWNDFWEEDGVSITGNPTASPDMLVLENTVKKTWVLPVELDGLTGDCHVNFPDDLLEAANLKEGDTVEWIDNGDGSCTLKKVIKKVTYDDMIAAGYTMTGDGFWIKE